MKKFSIRCKHVYAFGFSCFLFCVCCFEFFRLFCISRAPTPNVIYSAAQQSHKLEVFRLLQRKRAIVWCSNIRCKLKWPNGITHILRSLLSHIYIFCAENDFNGNSVNIRYVYTCIPCTILTTCITWSLLTHWALQKNNICDPQNWWISIRNDNFF